jgi:hypothetical protein
MVIDLVRLQLPILYTTTPTRPPDPELANTTPVVAPTVKSPEPSAHTPLAGVAVSVTVVPSHITEGPEILVGPALTVSVFVTEQPSKV